MKTKALTLLLLLAVIVLAGCTGDDSATGAMVVEDSSDGAAAEESVDNGALEAVAPVICKDTECMQDKFDSCTPAIFELELDVFIKMSYLYEIKGGTPQACTLYHEIKSIDLPEDAEVTEDEIAVLKELEGKSMTCVFSTQEMDDFYGDASDFDEMCSGSLKDMYLMGQFESQ